MQDDLEKERISLLPPDEQIDALEARLKKAMDAAAEAFGAPMLSDMEALKGSTDIGDQINKRIVGPLAAANKLADMPDFNDATKLGYTNNLI